MSEPRGGWLPHSTNVRGADKGYCNLRPTSDSSLHWRHWGRVRVSQLSLCSASDGARELLMFGKPGEGFFRAGSVTLQQSQPQEILSHHGFAAGNGE